MKKQTGNLLATALIIIVAVSAFGIAVLKLLTTESRAHDLFLQSHQSIYLAQSGMEYGLLQVKNNINTSSPATYCDDIYKTTQTFGNGEFRFKCTVYNPSGITTTSVTSANATIVNISSTSGLAPIGRVTIDSEKIDYSNVSTDTAICSTAPCLVVKKRGAGGTSAASHTSGSSVVQTNQIVVTAQGAIPTIASPTTTQEIQRAIIAATSEEISGFAVGNSGAIYRRTALATWSETALSPSTTANFNDVACFSATDCWAVGTSATTYRWNGSTWTQFSSGTLSGTLLSVSCPASNDCWISNSTKDIFRWNGTSWSLFTTFSSNKNSISCTSTSFCVAVGDGGSIHQWNGTSWVSATSPTTRDLNSVSCVSSSFCVAVGDRAAGPATNPGTIIRYNGTTWSSNTSPQQGSLLSVSCVSSTFCWAIADNRAQSATFNGTSWSLATIGGATKNGLTDIYCFTTTECIVVASRVSTSDADIRSWNGSTWTDDAVTISTTAQNLNAVIRFTPGGGGGVTITQIVWREVFN